jgi:hypothetical protein
MKAAAQNPKVTVSTFTQARLERQSSREWRKGNLLKEDQIWRGKPQPRNINYLHVILHFSQLDCDGGKV